MCEFERYTGAPHGAVGALREAEEALKGPVPAVSCKEALESLIRRGEVRAAAASCASRADGAPSPLSLARRTRLVSSFAALNARTRGTPV